MEPKATRRSENCNLVRYNSKGLDAIEKQHSESGTATYMEPKATRISENCNLDMIQKDQMSSKSNTVNLELQLTWS
jgi:hypothetical protein